MYSILYTLNPTFYPLYPIPYTLYPIPYTLYPISYTLYPIPHTLYPIPHTPCPCIYNIKLNPKAQTLNPECIPGTLAINPTNPAPGSVVVATLPIHATAPVGTSEVPG